jgi:catalase
MSDQSALAVEMVDEMERIGGVFPGYRRAHARGLCFQAVFTPSGAARPLTTAVHLQAEPVRATVRFSNASTDPRTSDVRGPWGMAVKFHLPDGTDTDIVSVSLSVFLAPTPEIFLEFLRATRPDPESGRPNPDRVNAFLGAHPESAPGIKEMAVQLPPVSYATARYSALHAFTWVSPNQSRKSVRYRWEPAAGIANLREPEAADVAPGYLAEELTRRLAEAPVVFTLRVQVAADRDPTDDATRPWPSDRPELVAGRLEVTAPVDDPVAGCEHRIFDPTRVTAGIECSDDPILNFRAQAYGVSYERRSQ